MNHRTKTLYLALALSLFTSPVTARQASPPATEDPELAAAQAMLNEGIAKFVQLDETREELVLDASAPAPEITAPYALDIQWGSGHGGTITLVRFTVEEGAVGVEEVSYDRGGRNESPSWGARRTTLEQGQVRVLTDLFRALERTQVSTRRKPDAPLGGSSSGSTNDFFVLARLLRPELPAMEREFCGYASSSGSLQYAGIRVVVNQARALIKGTGDWSDVAAGSLRQTHFTDAFTRNRDLMLKDFHWWVMERSVEALGVFGNRSALETLRFLDERYQDPQPRQRNKIRHLLALPEHYLSGPPQEVPETPPGR